MSALTESDHETLIRLCSDYATLKAQVSLLSQQLARLLERDREESR